MTMRFTISRSAINRAARLGARAACACAVLFSVACKDESPGGTPTSIEVVSTAPANGVVNTTVSPAPSFVVKNENGQAMKTGVTVTVSAGNGSLAGQPSMTKAGTTSVGTWTLGKTAGTNEVTVAVSGLQPVKFSVTGTAGPANKVAEVSPPATRSGLANAILTPAVVVAVQDAFGNAIAGQTVNFSIINGDGALTGNLTATTGANGQATAPSWRLGKSANAQTLRAISGALAPLDVNATVQTSYNIVVRFYDASSMTPQQQALFTAAAQRIMGVITGDVADVTLTSSFDLSGCGITGVSSLSETVDDIIIYATVSNIGGNVLASAGPCVFRAPGKLPLLGRMQFDGNAINSLSAGSLQEVITHEMLHVIGVGALWGNCSVCFNYVSGAGTLDPQYTAPQARAACQSVGGTVSCASTVPLEGCADRPSCQPPNGGGTRDSHWREATFGSELMTGFINTSPNPLSTITIGGLQDLGYAVNTGDNDSYTVAAGSIMANLAVGAEVRLLPLPSNWERINDVPWYVIDAMGRMRLVRTPQ